jgi:hypothetical protein
MISERRVRRSNERAQALCYQLQASAERIGSDFMVLACRDGFVVASSPWDADRCEDVAARMAALDLCEHSVGEIWGPGHTVAARAFEVQGERMFLGVGGENSAEVEPELGRAMAGVARILG